MCVSLLEKDLCEVIFIVVFFECWVLRDSNSGRYVWFGTYIVIFVTFWLKVVVVCIRLRIDLIRMILFLFFKNVEFLEVIILLV